MNSDVQSELNPRDYVLSLIGELVVKKDKLVEAVEQWQLLDDTGRVLASPSYAELIQHAAGAQALAHGVVQLARDFARTAHSTNRSGGAVLAHRAMAATMSSHAAPHFAETAEAALSLARSSSPTDRHDGEDRMVSDHATARAYLRRTSESLRDAVKELNSHLDFHRFFPTSSRQESPAPPLPAPSARHR